MSAHRGTGKTAFQTVLFLLSSILTIVGLNIIASEYFRRVDMTADQVYTLSGASKDLVHFLPDRMNVKLFVSEELPPDSKHQAQFTKDLLAEYAVYSNGKLHLEVVKIKSDESDKEKLARDCKVEKLTRGEQSKNKLQIASSYLGVCFDYHGQIESIPVVEQVEGLEYEISTIIKRMTVKKKKIAFARSEGEMTPEQGVQIFAEQLKRAGYDVVSVELRESIPEDVDALFVVEPAQKFTERAQYVLDQFLMRGRALAVFLSGKEMTVPKGAAMPGVSLPEIAQQKQVGLDILSTYGVCIGDDLILDSRNAVGPVPYAGKLIAANHPVFVAVSISGDKHPITRGLESLVLPYTSSVRLCPKPNIGAQPTFVELMSSSPGSYQAPELFVFDPMLGKRGLPKDVTLASHPLAYVGTGSFPSAFAGKSPVALDAPKEGEKEPAPAPAPREEVLQRSSEGARLLVVGGSKWISDSYLGLVPRGLKWFLPNLRFALNAVDWMVQDEQLSAVRNKSMQAHPLRENLSEAKIDLIKFGNILGVPLLVCLMGLLRWAIRQVRRNRMKAVAIQKQEEDETSL